VSCCSIILLVNLSHELSYTDVYRRNHMITYSQISDFTYINQPPKMSGGNRNFRSHVLSLPGAHGTFAPWYFRSVELSFPGTFVPWNFRSLERKWGGTFAPHSELTLLVYTLNRSRWNQRTPACGVNAQHLKQKSPAVAREPATASLERFSERWV